MGNYVIPALSAVVILIIVTGFVSVFYIVLRHLKDLELQLKSRDTVEYEYLKEVEKTGKVKDKSEEKDTDNKIIDFNEVTPDMFFNNYDNSLID